MLRSSVPRLASPLLAAAAPAAAPAPLIRRAGLATLAGRANTRAASPAVQVQVHAGVASPALCARPRPRPLANAAAPAPRAFSTTRTQRSKDTSWVNKGTVSYDELKPYTEAPSGEITIIDVREPNETAQGMIPAAVNVPLAEFKHAFGAGPGAGGADRSGLDFARKYSFERPAFDDKVIFYCRSGKRSAAAIDEVKRAGWWNVRNYEGSWLDWSAKEQQRGNLQDDD